MIISVASGKGGTGKTSVAVNMALSVGTVQLIDCDVEAPNAHLLLHPKLRKVQPVYTAIPLVDEALCSHCGECSKFCQYNAIFTSPQKVLVFPELCHSCGGCALVCPENAISWEKYRIGTLKFGSIGNLALVYGELEVGRPLAVPVIKVVKQHITKSKTVILDSPPGASCPFVETVKGSDFCVLVTEPTPFGLHDLKIAVYVLRKIMVPFGVIINRASVGDKKVYDYCKEENIRILMEVPYERKIAELYSQGVPFSLEMPEWTEKFQTLYTDIRKLVEK
ncbi:P-loop NTPase [Candidatus Bathyarchaeota archaeon A05DMB-2]|jgi:MinD superfamily P-loop ATPase|nr:P-loop NTPase [Candidatus Bathyarchaeota archaeon A05DMB-2]